MVVPSPGRPNPPNWPNSTHEARRRRVDILMWLDPNYTASWPGRCRPPPQKEGPSQRAGDPGRWDPRHNTRPCPDEASYPAGGKCPPPQAPQSPHPKTVRQHPPHFSTVTNRGRCTYTPKQQLQLSSPQEATRHP